ncbi:MAG: hypothetical protein JXR25_09380 [Pontiellaceae bacterium]|nr:hypothetical protein [Pontiellaceae bacterium]MBN2785027.1 hypothetical protein [Pontiellaceae bacterium]
MQITTNIASLGVQKAAPQDHANHQLVRHPVCLSTLNLSVGAGWLTNIEAAIVNRVPIAANQDLDEDSCIYDGGLCVARRFNVRCIGKCR